MNDQPNIPMSPAPAPAPVSDNNNNRIMAISSLVLGVINLCAWFLPICGVPVGIAGLALGYFGRRDETQKTLALIGMVLSGIGLLLACGNGALGAYMRLSGSNIGNIFSPP